MINILKQKVAKKIGRKIINRGDCELLSNSIFEMLDVDINYNTIRRLYGLAPAVKTSLNTLNVIAEFCDYKSYAHFTQTYLHEKESNLYVIDLGVTVKNRVHVANIMRRIRVMPDVQKVYRKK